MLASLRRGFEVLLTLVVGGLVCSLAVVVVTAVVYRKLGHSLTWYDEVASIQLAWLTYYGAALAALKRAHIGFPGLVESLPPGPRVAAVLLGEAAVILFFAILAYTGWWVLEVLEGDTLVSLTWVPTRFTQSVIPIAAGLVIIAQLLTAPEVVARAWRARPAPDPHGATPAGEAASP